MKAENRGMASHDPRGEKLALFFSMSHDSLMCRMNNYFSNKHIVQASAKNSLALAL